LSAGLIPTGSENGARDASGTVGLPARKAAEVRRERATGAADRIAVRRDTSDDRDAIVNECNGKVIANRDRSNG
jgi:hypothetical protein